MNRTASIHNYRRENNNYDFLAFKQIIFWLFFSLWFHLTKHSNSSLLLSLWSSSKYNCQNHQYCFLLSLFWGFELLIHSFLVGYYCKNAKFKIRGKKNLSNNASLEVSFFFFPCACMHCANFNGLLWKKKISSILHCKEEKILKWHLLCLLCLNVK